MIKEKAFTLAEVLIVLAIIGVVAAMTIPTMVANYQKQQYVTQLKKVYTELSQALKQMLVDQGVDKVSATDILTKQDSEDDNTAMQRAGNEFLKKYFKIAKECGLEAQSSCFAPEYSQIADSASSMSINVPYAVITSSGASIVVRPSTEAMAGSFVVDINGPNKPNIQGRDLFLMSFYYDGSIDSVTPECRKGLPTTNSPVCAGYADAFENRETRFSDSGPSYGVSFGKIINDNWKMDY